MMEGLSGQKSWGTACSKSGCIPHKDRVFILEILQDPALLLEIASEARSVFQLLLICQLRPLLEEGNLIISIHSLVTKVRLLLIMHLVRGCLGNSGWCKTQAVMRLESARSDWLLENANHLIYSIYIITPVWKQLYWLYTYLGAQIKTVAFIYLSLDWYRNWPLTHTWHWYQAFLHEQWRRFRPAWGST